MKRIVGIAIVSVVAAVFCLAFHLTSSVDNVVSVELPSAEWLSKNGVRFDGIGGISGGGATTRMLVEYDEKTRNEILDFLFKPNYGASLHMLKVEIGGDSQSTDGSESSHMHDENDINFHRGYEWWLMKEAKKRNPDILLYGLPWAFPSWMSKSGTKFDDPVKAANYTVTWLIGARDVHALHIDYIGIWNERDADLQYTIELRRVMDTFGFKDTVIVCNDSGDNPTFYNGLKNNKDYLDAVGIVGFHYPADNNKAFQKYRDMGKTVWSSEESSSHDNLNGAACWARIISSHFVISNITANLMWNLVGSYVAGTNWYGSSLLTAVQPWSGYYEFEYMPVVWATAHYTQFVDVGWKFLRVGQGSGELPQGGYYVTLVSPCGKHFATVIVKISRDHAPCTRPHLPDFSVHSEEVSLSLHSSVASMDLSNLAVWYSNFEGPLETTPIFKKLAGTGNQVLQSSSLGDSSVALLLNVSIGSVFTITNRRTGNKATPKVRNTPNASFPMPYQDDFSTYSCTNCYARYLSDQQGSFEIVSDENGLKVLRQTTPAKPITWQNFEHGPVTVIGMIEWEDVQVEATFRLPSIQSAAACIGTRTSQLWDVGVSLCVSSTEWYLLTGGALHGQWPPKAFLRNGTVVAEAGTWHTVILETNMDSASAWLDGTVLVEKQPIRSRDSGFAVLAVNDYFPVEFSKFALRPVGDRWVTQSVKDAQSWEVGTPVGVDFCKANGLTSPDQMVELLANWQIRHVPSGLCVTANADTSLALAQCDHFDEAQKFRHDYTRIRDDIVQVKNRLGVLCGTDKGVFLKTTLDDHSLLRDPTFVGGSPNWCDWTLYPSTFQLRNQRHFPRAGQARCLTVRSPVTVPAEIIAQT